MELLAWELRLLNDLGALMTDPQDDSFDNISDMPFTNLLSEQIVKR